MPPHCSSAASGARTVAAIHASGQRLGMGWGRCGRGGGGGGAGRQSRHEVGQRQHLPGLVAPAPPSPASHLALVGRKELGRIEAARGGAPGREGGQDAQANSGVDAQGDGKGASGGRLAAAGGGGKAQGVGLGPAAAGRLAVRAPPLLRAAATQPQGALGRVPGGLRPLPAAGMASSSPQWREHAPCSACAPSLLGWLPQGACLPQEKQIRAALHVVAALRRRPAGGAGSCRVRASQVRPCNSLLAQSALNQTCTSTGRFPTQAQTQRSTDQSINARLPASRLYRQQSPCRPARLLAAAAACLLGSLLAAFAACALRWLPSSLLVLPARWPPSPPPPAPPPCSAAGCSAAASLGWHSRLWPFRHCSFWHSALLQAGWSRCS